MPEPFNKKISLDNFIYTSFKEMKVPKICMLNPNLITIFNLLVATTIGYVFYNNKSIYLLIFLSFINRFLDILDGLVARKCNKTTKIGKYLDILSDTLLSLIILTITFFKINSKFIYIKFFILILISIFIYGAYKNMVTDNYELIGNNIVFQICHDNTIISVPLAVLIFYYFKNKFV